LKSIRTTTEWANKVARSLQRQYLAETNDDAQFELFSPERLNYPRRRKTLMISKLATLRTKIKISWFWQYIEYKAVNLINCRVLETLEVFIFYLFFPNNKNTPLLRGPPGSNMSYLLL